MKIEKYNNIITGFGSNIIGNILMFATTIFLTRMYTPEIYGEFRFIFSFIALSVIFLLLGRDSGIIYFTQNEPNQEEVIREEFWYSALVLFMGTIILFLLSNIIVKYFFQNLTLSYFQVSLIMIPLWGMFNLTLAGLKAKGFVNYSFILSNLTQRSLRVPFFILLTLLSVSYYSLAFGMILSQLILLYLALKKLPFIFNLSTIKLKNFFKRFKYAVLLGVNTVIVVLLTKIDVIMVGAYTDNIQVAIYDTSVLLAFVIMLPFVALVKSSEPVMKALIDDKETQDKYKRNLKLAIDLSLGILLFYILVPKEILSIFGTVYSSGSDVLIVLSVGYMLLILLGTPIELLNMNGFTKISTFILIFSIAINIALNYLLIPKFGMIGAAIATVVSLIFSKIVALVYVKQKYNINFVATFPNYQSGIVFFLLIIVWINSDYSIYLSLLFVFIFYVITLLKLRFKKGSL